MPTPVEYKAPFCSGGFYHIVCKSTDGLILFPEAIDHTTFMKRFRQFTGPFLDIWSYSLLNNHTHHISKIKPVDAIFTYGNELIDGTRTAAMKSFLTNPKNESIFDSMIERQMNSMLVSYANYYNNKYERKGGLFQSPFRRTQIHDDSHLQQAIIYVNANAQKHHLASDFKSYPYSSYNATISNNCEYINAEDFLNFFGGVEKFISLHESQVSYYYSGVWPSSKLE